jgi:hypothetical protein
MQAPLTLRWTMVPIIDVAINCQKIMVVGPDPSLSVFEHEEV